MPETPPVPARLLTGRYTSVVDGYSHAATDAASSQGAHQWHDQLKAACGSVTFLGVAVAPCDKPMIFRRHHAQVPANKCAFPCVRLPLVSAEPGTGPRPELAVALVLQRAHGGALVKLGEGYWDRSLPITGHLVGACDELTAAGLLVLADQDPHGLRRVTLTMAGQVRYEQFRCVPRLTGLPVPVPQFPAIKTPARERLNGPGPGQSDPHRPAEWGVGPLQWAYCPDEGRLHLLGPAEVVVAATGGHAEALCGRALAAAGLTLTHGSSGAVCMTCVNRIPSDPGTWDTP